MNHNRIYISISAFSYLGGKSSGPEPRPAPPPKLSSAAAGRPAGSPSLQRTALHIHYNALHQQQCTNVLL
ncbi:MAG: hypothetical protein NZ777_14135, partial [Pseudomonadales bacterium]|nr:hypothetical protein [Pseudomonadales bacterium]